MKLTATALTVFAFAGGVFLAAPAMASIAAGPITNPTNGHDYYLLNGARWTVAEAEAVSLGGHLATVNDQDENDWMYSTFATLDGGDRNMWIGFTDQAQEGTWVWSSGEVLSFSHWRDGEPDNSGNQDYAYIGRPGWEWGGWWWDDSATSEHWGVVEVIPEPGTISLLALGGIGLLCRRALGQEKGD